MMDPNFDIVPTLRMFDGLMMNKAADEIESLRLEVARLSANVAQGAEAAAQIEQYVLSVLPSVYYMDPPDGGSVSVLEQLRRMADDAAKYRASIAQSALTDDARRLELPPMLTPFGMLVRALRIVAGTTLYDMAKALLTTPVKLSAMEFGRTEVTPEFAFDIASYFDALGIACTESALRVAAAKGDGHAD